MSREGISAKAALDSADAALQVADSRYQDALEEVRNRQAVLEQRRTELELARQAVRDSSLTSPLDGIVRERHVTVGQYLAAGSPAVTIVRVHPLRLRVAVPERDAQAVRVNQEVQVTVEGDTTSYAGRVARLSPAIDEASRTLMVEAEVPNPAGLLRPGSFANASIVSADSDRAVIVPTSALVTFAGVDKVLSVKDGKVVEKRVTVGRRNAERIEIVSGLAAGDPVIAKPGNLVEGTPVRVARRPRAGRRGAGQMIASEEAPMKKLAAVCIERPVFAAMLIMCLVVVGTASYMRLGVDRFPAMDLPSVFIRTALPGASPEEVEVLVSQPIEEVVNTVQGLEELRSVSGAGNSIVIAVFSLDRDIEAATQDVRDRIATVLVASAARRQAAGCRQGRQRQLAGHHHRACRPTGRCASSPRSPTSWSSRSWNARAAWARSRSSGAWSARSASGWMPIGWPPTSCRSRPSATRWPSKTPTCLAATSRARRREQTLRTMGRVVDPRAFGDLVIATRNGVPIRVRDIGWAEDGTKEQRSIARLNGVPTVTLAIRRQTGANTVAVIEGVKRNLERVKPQIPGDVTLDVIRDQSRYIYAALHEINTHLVLGSVLACLVVFVFMRSWRATVIAGVAIPASVISTFGMMEALDFTLNSVTMLALVLMVGIVIDDAIVVLENIFRFVEEKKVGPFEAARAATAEIALPVLATTLSLAVIFIPVSFMSSIAGRFLYQFGITAAVAILVSLLVSFTLTPMMSARLLHVDDAAGHGGHGKAGVAQRLLRPHRPLLHVPARLVDGASVAHRGPGAGRRGVRSIPLYSLVRQEFVPSGVDEGEFEVSVNAPEGSSLAAMNDALLAVEKEVRSIPGVTMLLTSVGGSFLGSVNQGELYVRLAPHEERVFSWGRLISGMVAAGSACRPSSTTTRKAT